MKNKEVTKDQVIECVAKYIKENHPTQSLKMVLSKNIGFSEGNIIRIPINNKVEISMVQNVEQSLLDYLRHQLHNSDLKIEYDIPDVNEERKPYTSSEIFEAMAKKNPALLKLKEDFGLDTDY